MKTSRMIAVYYISYGQVIGSTSRASGEIFMVTDLERIRAEQNA